MSRERLIEMARVQLDHQRAGTMPLAPSVTRLPVANYFEPTRWQREIDLLFKRVPLALAMSAELTGFNTYKAVDVVGVPLLLVRGGDGRVRGFVNMCSHRGAKLVPDGGGTARRFTCPYHAWSFDAAGDLVGVFRERSFGDLDHACFGLTPVTVAERAGIVWGGVSPQHTPDVDAFLGEFGELLGHLRFAEMFHYGRRELAGPNWKVAFDGYTDIYHLPVLHRQTFGEDISPDGFFHQLGPHQRITGPRGKWLAYADRPEEDWPMDLLTTGIWSIFPHGSIAGFEIDGGTLWQVARIFPGDTPETSVSHLDYVSLTPPSPAFQAAVDRQIDFLVHVVRDEDYATGLDIQRTVRTGAKTEFVFGRNEGGAQHVHCWIDRVLATPDDELDELFRSARTGVPATAGD
jgi:phenylpropionate dioxygenase-like ring-hydroxylating dioxygenase large terminal subunit